VVRVDVLDANHHAVSDRRRLWGSPTASVVGHHDHGRVADGELCTVPAGGPALGEAKRVAQPRHRLADVGVDELGDDL
jgi:hypothetical protein